MAMDAVLHVGFAICVAIGERQVKLEVRAKRHYVFLEDEVAVQQWLRACFCVGIHDVGTLHVGIARKVLFRTFRVRVDVQVLEEIAHLSYAAHGEEVARRAVAHDALSLAGLGKVAIPDFVCVRGAKEMPQLVSDGGIAGHGKAVCLAIGRRGAAQRCLAGQ